MTSFTGFPAGKVRMTPIPATFFTDLLPEIDNLGELRTTLYAIWHLDHQEGTIRYLLEDDFLKDERFIQGFGKTDEERKSGLRDSLERACQRGTFISVGVDAQTVYFLNSPRGRAASEGLAKGTWTLNDHPVGEISLEMERPNIFDLYEKNIGPLTPMISQTLQEAEKLYPEEWIEEAIRTAVLKNARNWRYVEAILRAWKEKGRDETNRRNTQEDRRKYIEGEFADFIEH